MDSQFHCKYVYGALECAASKLKLYKKIIKKKPDAKKPHVSTNHLIMDNMSYKIDQDIIRIPTQPEKYVFIKLTKYVLEKIRNMKLGQITITIDKLIISYSKEIPVHKSTNFLGIDRNLNNLTTCDSSGDYIIHDLANAQKIITLYGTVKSKFKRNDVRIRKRIFQKYGRLQRNRVNNILNCTSKNITSKNAGIIWNKYKVCNMWVKASTRRAPKDVLFNLQDKC